MSHTVARLLGRAPKLYPDARANLGDKVGLFHDRHWWYPIGNVQEQFQKAEPEIQEQLRDLFADTYSEIIYFRLYMIGRCPDTAIPTIMFFCPSKDTRKKAKRIIDEGGILNRLPGFRTGHQCSQPKIGRLIQPASNRDSNFQQDSITITREVYFDSSRPIEPIALPIFVNIGSSWRRASANTVFEGRKRVLLSVSHIFLNDTTSAQTPIVDSDSDFDFGSGSESEDDGESVEITSQASVSSAEGISDTTDSTSPDSELSMQTMKKVLTELVHERSNDSPDSQNVFSVPSTERETMSNQHDNLEYLGCLTKYSSNLDWALIDISSSKVNATLQDTMSSNSIVVQEHNMHMAVHTSHGLILGTISDGAVYMRLPHSTTFEKVFEISLETPLDWGDCGAVVYLTGASEPYGYIVASSSDKNIAYATAAAKVFADSGTRWDRMETVVDDPFSDPNVTDADRMHGNISTHLPESDSESPSIVVHPLIGYLAPRQRRTPSQGSLSKRTRKSSYRRGHRRIASGTSLEKKPKHGTTTAPDRVVYIGQLHAANYGIGPGTSPYEQSPNQTDLILPEEIESDHSEGSTPLNPLQERKLQVAAIPLPSQERPAHAVAPAPGPTKEEPAHKKTIDDFTILEEMGRGAYGEVKLCQYKEKSSKKVVIKYITKRRILVETWAHDPRLGTVPLEIHVLDFLRSHDLQHPNIVEMADFFEDDINYYIEMVPHDLPSIDLFDYLELHTNMEEKECREIFVQIAEAVQFLHEKAMVVHRDIKDENIVLDNKGKIQLVDFGSAAYIKSGPFDVFVGTIDYAAPEVLAGRPYRGKEQDVWALGILLYTIIYKENPFYSIDEIMDHDLRVPWVMSEESIDLVRLMLDRDVEKRITINQVLEHSWCAGGNGDADSSSK